MSINTQLKLHVRGLYCSKDEKLDLEPLLYQTSVQSLSICVRYLQEKLVFGDSLDRFDEEVTDGQSGLDLLLDSL